MLIFLVLGTIMMGLATPTEAGAMGTIGAIVLAVVRNAPLTRFDKWTFGAGCVAAGVGFADRAGRLQVARRSRSPSP